MNNLKRKYFEIWADEEAQNLILKWLLILSMVTILGESTCLCFLSLRHPDLIALGEKETKFLTLTPPKPELLRSELERTVSNYALTHYNWDWNSVEKAHKEASKYVSEKFQKAFIASNVEQMKLAKEKKVVQKVYLAQTPDIDTDKLTAKITLDRIFSIEGIKATSPLTLEISFEYGPRTSENPEGIYVIGEKLLSEPVK
jgi:hypothetical protein